MLEVSTKQGISDLCSTNWYKKDVLVKEKMRPICVLNLGDRVFADFEISGMRTTFVQQGNGEFWQCNAIGGIHSPDEFEVGEEVWFSLAGHLYRGKIGSIKNGTFRVLGYGFGEDSRNFTCGVNCDLEQIVKLDRWQEESDAPSRCPYPRI